MVTAISDEMFTGQAISDPYGYFGRLREEDPVHWNEKYEVWVVTSHDEVVWFTRHPEYFSSQVFKNDPRDPYPAIDESDLGLYKYVREFFSKWMIQQDRPRHMDERQTVHRYFTPKAMESWRPMVQSIIKDLLDEAEQSGHMDVMKDFATPLPLFVIAQMLGIPTDDRKFIRTMAEKLLYIGRGEADRMQFIAESIEEQIEYLTPLVEERMAKPRDEDDLLSVLCEGEKSGALTREGVVANAILLLLAGHETTINLICNGTLAFIKHPDQWQLLKNSNGEMVPPMINRATEECLRYDPPVKSLQRLASEDVEVRGKLIRKDERVRWFISGANRDPEKHVNPDTFDITRWPNTHVAFGSGIHHCLGATPARLEGQEAFKALAQRYSSIEAETDELEYVPSITFRSLKNLPVTLN